MSIPDYGEELDEDGFPVGSLLKKLVSGAWLDAQEFPPLEEIVPGIITEGFGIIAGPPKAGKSWWVGNIAAACASGGHALGRIKVDRRPVLYLALEDGHRRLQSRFRVICDREPIPAGLDLMTAVEPGMVTATIAEWLVVHRRERPLVILDTLGKARPQRRSNEDGYIADYQLGSRLKHLIDDIAGAGLLVVHHTRKATEGDFVDAVSGTQGIAGSADYILVLRRKRKAADAVLAVTGRDVIERELAMTTDGGRWTLDGRDVREAARRIEDKQTQAGLSDRSVAVLKVVNDAEEPVRAATIVEAMPDLDIAQARVYLNRLADSGHIEKSGRGLYTPVCFVTSVTDSDPSPSSNETEITKQTLFYTEEEKEQ